MPGLTRHPPSYWPIRERKAGPGSKSGVTYEVMAERTNPITPAGFRALREEYEALYAGERPKLLETIAWAAANGDRSENADYQDGRRRLREIDRRINFLARRMKAAKVTDPAAQPDKSRVRFGATVMLADQDDAGAGSSLWSARTKRTRARGRISFELASCPRDSWCRGRRHAHRPPARRGEGL